jgi:UDP-glucose 4-epimerase
MNTVLVTGASGFLGQPLCAELVRHGHTVRAAVRTARPALPGVQTMVTGDIGALTEWRAALEGVEMVVHAAARTHVLRDSAANARRYFEVNAQGTEHLARAAAAAGVRRFIYLSSIKVNGESTTEQPYRSDDVPCPQDDYGRSKLQAEISLAQAAQGTAMETAIVRPPLIYGPGVRANFLRLMHWVDRRRPLPFGAIHNARSLVSVWTVNDLLLKLLRHPRSVTGVWLVADGEDLATPDLIRRIGRSLEREVRLLRVPRALLLLGGSLAGKRADLARLCGSLQVDAAPTRRALAWAPPLSLDEALQRTAAWYVREYR